MNIPDGLMCERRPRWVDFKIESYLWAVEQKDRHGEWIWMGKSDDYLFDCLKSGDNTRGSTIAWLLQRSQEELPRGHIVDAGAYLGATLKSIRDKAGFQRATALSYLSKTKLCRDPGDIQQPEVYKGLSPANLIVSQVTFVHLQDRLAGLELLVNALALGGHLVIDLKPIVKSFRHVFAICPLVLAIRL